MAAFSINRTESQIAVAITGDLTASLVPSLQGALKQELASGAKDVVFDMANTDVMDSSGIGLLIATVNSLTKVGGSIQIVNLSASLLQLLQSMRLVTRLNASIRQA